MSSAFSLVLRSHGDSIVPRLAELKALESPAGAKDPSAERAERFLGRLEDLSRQIEIPSWDTFKVAPENHARIAENAVRNGSNGSNPRTMTAEDYLRILTGLSGVEG